MKNELVIVFLFRSVRFCSFGRFFSLSLSHCVEQKKGAVCSLNIFTYSFNAIAFVSHYTTYIYMYRYYFTAGLLLLFCLRFCFVSFRFLLVFGAIRWRDTASQAKKKNSISGFDVVINLKLFIIWRPLVVFEATGSPMHSIPCQPPCSFISSLIQVILYKI